jgi:hypothetical protein
MSRATSTGKSWTAFMIATWGFGLVSEVTAVPPLGEGEPG